ncbi:MAG: DUF21 domain-containing protein [Deltaproteobacteria bacterium]|nr:DUF21 domain-containing protein [Deltaproteobacteria bacterium]
MLYLLLLIAAGSIVLLFFVSIMEAALFAVPLAHVRHQAEQGSRSAKLLLELKTDIERPITALLILATVSTTGGATLAGATAGDLWGEQGLLIFSIVFAALTILCGEFLPKVLGVMYSKQISALIGYPLSFLVKLFSPVIFILQKTSERLKPHADAPSVSQEEVLSMAAIGTQEGALDKFEGSVINNVIRLDKLLVRDILTPRIVVFRVEENLTIAEIESDLLGWQYTRVPLFSEDDPEHLTRYVRQRDIYREIVKKNRDLKLKDISRPLTTVPELAAADKILFRMFEKNEQICAVVDEHGGLAGIITLEDMIEEVVGHEIVDEYDLASDAKGG